MNDETMPTKRTCGRVTRTLLLCAMAVCAILALPSQGMAASLGARPHAASADSTTWDAAHANALVQKANPYVYVINYHATIDPALKTVVSPQDFAAVTAQVDHYNSLPLSQRSLNATASATAISGQGVSSAGCNNNQPSVRVVSNWYGPSVYTNDCVTQQIRNSVAVGVAIATAFKNYACYWLGLDPPAAATCLSVATAIQTIGGITLASVTVANHGNGVWWNVVFGIPTITTA